MEFCKGCCRGRPCIYDQFMEECPCGICLIKGVCQRACQEFIDFVAEKQNIIIDTFPPYKPKDRGRGIKGPKGIGGPKGVKRK